MPAPTEYSENDLAEYMIEILADIATVLGWDGDTPQITRAVYAVQRAYPDDDLEDVSGATDMPLLEALARREALKAAATALAARVDIGSPAGDAKLAQQHAQCMRMLSLATFEAEQLLGDVASQAIVVRPVRHTEDPYRVQGDAELSA